MPKYPVLKNLTNEPVGFIEEIGNSIVLWSPLLIDGQWQRIQSIPSLDLQDWIDTLQAHISGITPLEAREISRKAFNG